MRLLLIQDLESPYKHLSLHASQDQRSSIAYLVSCISQAQLSRSRSRAKARVTGKCQGHGQGQEQGQGQVDLEHTDTTHAMASNALRTANRNTLAACCRKPSPSHTPHVAFCSLLESPLVNKISESAVLVGITNQTFLHM
jgi:hypothetical protein